MLSVLPFTALLQESEHVKLLQLLLLLLLLLLKVFLQVNLLQLHNLVFLLCAGRDDISLYVCPSHSHCNGRLQDIVSDFTLIALHLSKPCAMLIWEVSDVHCKQSSAGKSHEI